MAAGAFQMDMQSAHIWNRRSPAPVPIQISPQIPKLELPRCNGLGIINWIYECDRIFSLHRIPPESKVKFAALHLDGLALQWHLYYMRLKYDIYPYWHEYVVVVQRFGNANDEPRYFLAQKNQTRSVHDYRVEFGMASNQTFAEFSQLHFQKPSDLVPNQHSTLVLQIDFQKQGDAPDEDLSEAAANTAEEDFSDHHQPPFDDLVADPASEIMNEQKSMDPTPFFFDSPLAGENGTEKSQVEDNPVADPMSEENKFTVIADSVSVIVDEQKVPPPNSVSIRSETSLPCFEIANSVRFSAFLSLLTPIINSWSHSVPSVERDGSSRRLLIRPPSSMIELPPWFYLPPKPPDRVAISAPSLNPSLPVTTTNEFAAIQYPAIYSYISLLNALQMFDQRPRCLVAVCKPTITGCTGNGHEDVACNLFKDMHQMEVKPGNSLGNALAPLLAQSNEFAKFFMLRNATWTSLLVIRRWAHTVLVEALLARISIPGIPASSLMTFLNKNPGNSGVILGDYGSVFVNNSSHSQLDDLSNVSPLVVIVVSLVAISFVFAFKPLKLLSMFRVSTYEECIFITPIYNLIKAVAIRMDIWSKPVLDIDAINQESSCGHLMLYSGVVVVAREAILCDVASLSILLNWLDYKDVVAFCLSLIKTAIKGILNGYQYEKDMKMVFSDWILTVLHREQIPNAITNALTDVAKQHGEIVAHTMLLYTNQPPFKNLTFDLTPMMKNCNSKAISASNTDNYLKESFLDTLELLILAYPCQQLISELLKSSKDMSFYEYMLAVWVPDQYEWLGKHPLGEELITKLEIR